MQQVRCNYANQGDRRPKIPVSTLVAKVAVQ